MSERDSHDDPPFADEKDERRLRERLEKLIPDVVRRAVYAGATQVPKEVAAYLMAQAAASKDEVLRIFGQEVRRFLETVNLSGELQKLLTSLSFEIKTEIRFIPNDQAVGAVKPDIKNKVSVKSKGGDDPK